MMASHVNDVPGALRGSLCSPDSGPASTVDRGARAARRVLDRPPAVCGSQVQTLFQGVTP